MWAYFKIFKFTVSIIYSSTVSDNYCLPMHKIIKFITQAHSLEIMKRDNHIFLKLRYSITVHSYAFSSMSQYRFTFLKRLFSLPTYFNVLLSKILCKWSTCNLIAFDYAWKWSVNWKMSENFAKTLCGLSVKAVYFMQTVKANRLHFQFNDITFFENAFFMWFFVIKIAKKRPPNFSSWEADTLPASYRRPRNRHLWAKTMRADVRYISWQYVNYRFFLLPWFG